MAFEWIGSLAFHVVIGLIFAFFIINARLAILRMAFDVYNKAKEVELNAYRGRDFPRKKTNK